MKTLVPHSLDPSQRWSVSPTPRIGLCLSSGGARGLAHVGVIQVLEEAGVPIAAIGGTSMGAYVGALLAAGLHYPDLYRLAAEITDRRALMKLLDPSFPPSRGLIKGEKIRRHLERSLGGRNFSELSKPLLVVATDLAAKRARTLDSGPVAHAVHASAAIPGVCEPVMLDGFSYTDGGASDPLPVTRLRERFALDAIIAVDVVMNPTDEALPPPPRWWSWLNLLAHGNVLDTYQRALGAAQRQLAAREGALAEVLIRPQMHEAHWYDFEQFERYIEAGRAAARQALPAILQLLHPPTTPHRHETLVPYPPMGCHAA